MTEENVFLFVPNLIGYARIILALFSFYYMPTHCVLSMLMYIVSALLDAIDGHAARYFNQSTKFGAMLDQLTDRMGTMCLCVTLSTFYPKYQFLFQISMVIDIASHWIYLHTTVLQGKASHKFVDLSGNPIMHLYYNSKLVLFSMCFGNEAFYISLYLLHFFPRVGGLSLLQLIAIVSAPVAIVKSCISLVHCYVACQNLAIIDLSERSKMAPAEEKKKE